MGIYEFLKTLDLSQLRNAVEIAGTLIKSKENEKKVQLWIVSDDSINYAAFLKEDYQKAVDALILLAQRHKESGKEYNFELSISKSFERESEVAGWLEMKI